MKDSIQYTNDSVSRLNVDSVLSMDSLNQAADSLLHVDSTRVAATLPSGFEGILHPSAPSTESWVFIAIILLFLLLVSGIVRSAGEFFQNIKAFFSKKESVSLLLTPTVNIAQFHIFITLFSISVIALFVYELFFSEVVRFEIKTFVLLFGITAGYYILKHILFDIAGYTFFNRKITKTYKKMYFSLINVLTVALFPVLILYTYQPLSWQESLEIITACLAAIFYMFLIMKLFQIFYSKPLDLFYIILYLCTLEIIPILVLFRAYITTV